MLFVNYVMYQCLEAQPQTFQGENSLYGRIHAHFPESEFRDITQPVVLA